MDTSISYTANQESVKWQATIVGLDGKCYVVAEGEVTDTPEKIPVALDYVCMHDKGYIVKMESYTMGGIFPGIPHGTILQMRCVVCGHTAESAKFESAGKQ